MKTISRILVAGTLALTVCTASITAEAQRNRREDTPPPPLQVIPVQGDIYMIPGAGGNITLQIGKDGVLVVDTGLAVNAERVLAAIRGFTDKPIRRIVNTHAHPDHTGGNEPISLAGQNVDFRQGFTSDPYTPSFAHELVLHRMSGVIEDTIETPPGAWPLDTYHTEKFDMYFNGESIQLLHQPNAHTDGDTIVYFRRSDVISTGDVYVTTTYPLIDTARGGSLQGILDALNRIIDLMIPDANEEGGTLAISGHGRISDEYEVVNYRDMLTIIRDRIVGLTDMGMSLEQVKAARPTLDYDGRYGANSALWSTDRFIEAVYREFAR